MKKLIKEAEMMLIKEQVRVRAKTKTVQRIMDQYIGISPADVIEDLIITLAEYQKKTAEEVANMAGEKDPNLFKAAELLKKAGETYSKRNSN